MTKLEELKGLLVKFNDDGLTETELKSVTNLYFDEIDEADKTEELTKEVESCTEGVQANEDKVDDKEVVEEDKDTTEETVEDEKKEEDEEDKKDDEKEEEDDKEEDKVEANEDKAITISASEYSEFKGMAKSLSKLTRQARKRDLEDKVKSMSFSDENKESIILPKSTDNIVDFALSLSEPQSEKFLSIIENLQKLSLGEIGSSKEAKKVDSDTEMVNRASKMVKEFAEKGERITMGQAMSKIEDLDAMGQ